MSFVMAGCVVLAGAAYVWAYGPSYLAYWRYAPQDGDIVFQSLPRSRLVNAIEGVTNSPLSHCGLVVRQDGQWVVYEAYRGVEITPLDEFIFRGRGHGFAVCRLKPDRRQHVPAMIDTHAVVWGVHMTCDIAWMTNTSTAPN